MERINPQPPQRGYQRVEHYSHLYAESSRTAMGEVFAESDAFQSTEVPKGQCVRVPRWDGIEK